jgi:hypothetical protein
MVMNQRSITWTQLTEPDAPCVTPHDHLRPRAAVRLTTAPARDIPRVEPIEPRGRSHSSVPTKQFTK